MRRLRVLGKLCPLCSSPGEVLIETEGRIVFECPNGHEYETKKSSERSGHAENNCPALL